jgi:hypothetical protein
MLLHTGLKGRGVALGIGSLFSLSKQAHAIMFQYVLGCHCHFSFICKK